jgi:L-ribulose-5-phosphate 3-epimerase
MALAPKLVVNLWTVFGWQPRAFDVSPAALDRLAAAGAGGVELILDDGEHTFERVLAARPNLLSALESRGLRAAGVACRQFFEHNPASESAHVRGRALRVMRSACRVASEYGADTVLVIPGMQEPGTAYGATYAAAVQTLAQAARYAETYGVAIVVENVPVDFLQSPREFRQLLDDVGSPAVKACVDLGNVIAANQRFPQNWIFELRDHIRLIHAKDYVRGPDHGTRVCGEGEVPWHECFAALEEVDYQGPLVVETPPYGAENVSLDAGLAAAEASLRWLLSVHQRPSVTREALGE